MKPVPKRWDVRCSFILLTSQDQNAEVATCLFEACDSQITSLYRQHKKTIPFIKLFTKEVFTLTKSFHQGTAFHVPSPQHCKRSAVPPTSQLTAECASRGAWAPQCDHKELMSNLDGIVCVASLAADWWQHNVQTLCWLTKAWFSSLLTCHSHSQCVAFPPWWWIQINLETAQYGQKIFILSWGGFSYYASRMS